MSDITHIWMSQEEIDVITKYLSPDKHMLEWGAGGSTLFFSTLVKTYTSIEHDSDWYNDVLKVKPLNVLLHHVPNNLPRTIPTDPIQFEDYINYVDTLNKKFDLVLIDGRARPQCAEKVIPYLSDDAVVFIHDFWQRPEYHWVFDMYEEVESIKKGQSIVALRLK